MRYLGAFLVFLISAQAIPAMADDEYSYGPACQYMRFLGEVRRPPELGADRSIQLTVTYRFEDQQAPATLLTNYPLSGNEFAFVLSGFNHKLAGVLFVPPMFFFNKRIEFDYFARTPDGAWVSDWGKSIYHRERIKKAGKVLCQTAIHFDPLVLHSRH